MLPGLEADGTQILSSRQALALKKLPSSLAILGAGAIGVEFAYFFRSLGCAVTLIERQANLLPLEDQELGKTLQRSFQKQGIQVLNQTTAKKIELQGKVVSLELEDQQGKPTQLKVESLLLAIGLEPNTQDLFAPQVQPVLEKGYLKVDERYQTSLPKLYAAGDIIGPPWLAHVATYEAVQAVNGIVGHSQPKRVDLFPSCTYCQPQVASVGLSEEQLKAEGRPYKVGKFPFQASGKAVAINHPEGFVKVLIDPSYEEILGAHIIGSDATELIQEYALAIQNELTATEIHHTIHAHPTMSETLAEAISAASNEAIHI